MWSERAELMAKQVTIEAMDAAISKILDEYNINVIEDMQEAVKKAAKEGVKVVKSNSRVFNGTGEYAKGWTSKVETGRTSAQGIIYNKSLPGLPHLLEHGHAKRNGGRVAGRVHIEPVQKALEESFTKELERKL